MVACPCCGSETDVPMLYKGVRQHVLAYIWNNPNCTTREISLWLYKGKADLRVITRHISSIRQMLLEKTNFAMVNSPQAPRRKRGMPAHKYKIILRRPEGKTNGTTILPTILP